MTVVTHNRLNNAVESDATIVVTVGKTPIATFKGDKNPWSYTAQSVATNTSYRIEATGHSRRLRHEQLLWRSLRRRQLHDHAHGHTDCSRVRSEAAEIPLSTRRFEGLNDDATPTPRCETTWGVVRGSEVEHDADAETWVQPTKKEFDRLFSAAPRQLQLPHERLPVGRVESATARSTISAGVKGSHDAVRRLQEIRRRSEASPKWGCPTSATPGCSSDFLVYDCGHFCWTELHPAGLVAQAPAPDYRGHPLALDSYPLR